MFTPDPVTFNVIPLDLFKMQVSASYVLWPEVDRRDQDGTLYDELCSLGGTQDWMREPSSWWSDSFIHYQSVIDTYASIAPNLDRQNKERATASLGVLFTEFPVYDLENVMEFWFMAAAPDSVNSIAENLASLDFGQFHLLFDKYCSEGDKEILEDYDNDFLGYIFQWKDAILEAQSMNWGLLGHMG